MEITEMLIRPDSPNRPGKQWNGRQFQVRGIVSHRTGNPGATALDHFNYFNTLVDREASAHYFVDSQMILRIIPEDEIAWHARGANFDHLGIELCEPLTPEAYRKYVWLHADICKRYNLDPVTDIKGHFEYDPKNRSQDPRGLFYWGQFKKDVLAEIERMRGPQVPAGVPDWAVPSLLKMIAAGIVQNPEDSHLDLYRLAVILDRAGVLKEQEA